MIDKTLYCFIIFTIVLVVGSFLASFYIVNYYKKQRNEKQLTIIEFLNNNQKINMKSILIGMSFGIVFGFIDNAGLWLGLTSFQKYIPGGILTKSGWGNTYSDGLGATLGTSVAVILKTMFPLEHEAPIWADAVGIVLGCILGIYIPRLITGDEVV